MDNPLKRINGQAAAQGLPRASRKDRLPSILPHWARERIEVNVYELKRFVRRAAQALPEGVLVLDAGAGEGRFKPDFARQRYIGLDLAVGDTDWDYGDLDVVADLLHLPFADAVFEATLCTQTLEHVAEPALVIRELGRVLQPGGRLYLTAPQSWHQHQKPHDYFRYTSFGLRYLIEGVGLRVESIQPLGGYFWFLSFQLQMLIYWAVPKPSARWKRACLWPLKLVLGLVFQAIVPLLLFYLDPLDRAKDETFGHACVAVKEK
jgi:SAM-dependent methyltransferase